MQETIRYDMSGLSGDLSQNRLMIYVAPHCNTCRYAHDVADDIRHRYPQVVVKLIDIEATSEAVPDEVFATPTYMLDGQVWSLGNPSKEKIQDAFGYLRDGE